MTRPRSSLVSLASTPYYHCVARCVRRAFLCGIDAYSGRSFEHRKPWVVDRLAELSAIFAIDVCAYAVMSNHYHLVLRLDAARARAWSDDEVIARWGRLFGLPLLVALYQQGQVQDPAVRDRVADWVATWRARLADLSWYMRCLNEHLARKANAEDGCTGRFWEGRFKSQALLDEAALLTCMSYVDLNPIRAGLAQTPEDSDFTSIQARIREWAEDHPNALPVPLLPLTGPEHEPAPEGIAFAPRDYLELVDWAGRAVREGKRGAIPPDLPPILARLKIAPEPYLRYLRHEERGFGRAIGRANALRDAAIRFGVSFMRGTGQAQQLFPA